MSQPEQRSAILRRIEADKVRQSGVIPLGVSPRPALSAETIARAQTENAARRLPDALVAGDTEAKRLHAVHQGRKTAVEKSIEIRRWLDAEHARLTDQIRIAESELAWTAVFDALAGDGGFAGARGALAALSSDRELLALVAQALKLMRNGTLIADAVSRDGDALNARMFALKVEHVEAGQAQKGGVAA